MIDSVLMYPNIHLKDTKTVKEGLLLYDNLYRIVPEEIEPDDIKEIQTFIEEYGLIKNIDPSNYIKNTYNKVEKNIDRWKENATGIDFKDEKEDYDKLHKGKVYEKLHKQIVNEGILDFDGTWYRGDDSFISSYMMVLAQEISNKNSLGLLTYENPAWTCQEFLNYDGQYSSLIGDKTHALIGVYLFDYLPLDIDTISFDSIMEFRDRFKYERQNFLKVYLNFQKELENIAEKVVIDDKIESQMDQIREGVEEFKKACSYFKIDKFFGLKLFTIPVVIEKADLLIDDPTIKSILFSIGMAIGGIWGIFSKHREIRIMNKSNPYSYLVQLEKYAFEDIETIGSSLASDINEFIED